MYFRQLSHSFTTVGSVILLLTSGANAGEVASAPHCATSSGHEHHGLRPDSHAPIGVMGDHVHGEGGIMLSYRYMFMHMDGLRSGTSDVSNSAAFKEGYGAVPLEMDMHMHMPGIMYAPTEWLTVMAMTSYVFKDMENLASPHAMYGAGHGGHMPTGQFSHSSEGWGDTAVTTLFKLYDGHRQRVQLGLGLGLPTADVEEKENGIYLPYGMQLGSGTWDLLPSLTYRGETDRFSWGAQASGAIRLESANSSGYALGDEFHATAWGAWMVGDWISISARLSYGYQDDIRGHYNGPHGHISPAHFQENYGGHVVDAGLGVNFLIPRGFLKGNRLAAEVILPVYQDLNGLQLKQSWGLIVGWQWAF